MHKQPKRCYNFLLSLILLFFLTGCSHLELSSQLKESDNLEKGSSDTQEVSMTPEIIPSQVEQNNAELDAWVGNYEFYEYYPPNINMDYVIAIYKKNNDYVAEIYVDGFQTSWRIEAKVISNKNRIDLAFEKYLPNDYSAQDLKTGDIILSLEVDDSNLITYWGKMEPILPENMDSGKVYFEKVDKE